YPRDGTLGEPDEKGQTIPFTVDGDKLTPKLANITGMSFYREPRDTNAVCMIYDTAGNAIAAKEVVSDGSKVTVTMTDKVTLEMDAASIAKYDYNMGKLIFLSD